MPWTILGNWVPEWNISKYPVYSQEQVREARRRFIEDMTLPVQMSPEARNILKMAGVVFGEIDRNDPIFQHVTLPTGWWKAESIHPFFTELLNEEGHLEALIFYKPAFFALEAKLLLV